MITTSSSPSPRADIPFLDLAAEHRELAAELNECFRRVLAGGRYILGPEVNAFEGEFAEYCNRRYCIGVGNGLDALQLLFRAAGIGPGDDVIVPAYTAVATWMAVSLVGATPVGADVDPRTFNIDREQVAAQVSSRTKAIVAVHLFGQPADMDPLGDIAREHGLLFVEDAAQAHGARYRGRVAGSIGDAAAFSFYPTKNLGAIGDGGAIVTDDGDLADRVRMLRAYGWRTRDNSELVGVNTRLDELQAAFLRLKLKRLEDWNTRRRELAGRYHRQLADIAEITLPHVIDSAEPVWHLFVICHKRRDQLAAGLLRRRIGTLVHYNPLPHVTQAYRNLGWEQGMFPVAESLSARALSLPLFPQLNDDAVDAVAAAVADAA